MACDMGCGPGHVARYLHERGVPVCGVDLSPELVKLARRLTPDIPFEQGDMRAIHQEMVRPRLGVTCSGAGNTDHGGGIFRPNNRWRILLCRKTMARRVHQQVTERYLLPASPSNFYWLGRSRHCFQHLRLPRPPRLLLPVRLPLPFYRGRLVVSQSRQRGVRRLRSLPRANSRGA